MRKRPDRRERCRHRRYIRQTPFGPCLPPWSASDSSHGPGRQRLHAADADRSDRSLRLDGSAVAQLPEVVAAPAVQRAVRLQRDSKCGSGGNGDPVATDANPGNTLTYAISGTDAALFEINSTTGVLTFKALPDFEAPADANTDNDYELTVTVSDGNGGTDTQDITVTVTQVTDSGAAVWSNTTATPQISDWDGTGFGTTSGTATLSERYRTVQGADAPTRDEKIVVGIDANNPGQVTGEMWDGTSWSALPLGMGNVSESYWYGAEVAYEQQSGDAVVVWNNGSQLQYAVWDGSSWTAAQSITAYTGSEPQNLRLAFDPGSDAMVLVVNDVNADDYALVWDGDSWGNAITLDTTGTLESDQSAIAVSFEAQSGNAMVTYGIDGSSAAAGEAMWSRSSVSIGSSDTSESRTTRCSDWSTRTTRWPASATRRWSRSWRCSSSPAAWRTPASPTWSGATCCAWLEIASCPCWC